MADHLNDRPGRLCKAVVWAVALPRTSEAFYLQRLKRCSEGKTWVASGRHMCKEQSRRRVGRANGSPTLHAWTRPWWRCWHPKLWQAPRSQLARVEARLLNITAHRWSICRSRFNFYMGLMDEWCWSTSTSSQSTEYVCGLSFHTYPGKTKFFFLSRMILSMYLLSYPKW